MKAGSLVTIRTFSAGVHVGTLVSQKGKKVVLKNARRIWSWSSGALSLHEVSTRGITGGKVSVQVDRIVLTEAIEVISLQPSALQKIASFEVG